MPTLADYYSALTQDQWRNAAGNEFTEEIVAANKVLNHPYANNSQRREALSSWLHKHQPCVFGRIAAKQQAIDYCFLTNTDLMGGDEAIARKIKSAKALWKHRALRGDPKHGFMLVLCDTRVSLAAPNDALYRFSLHLQNLAGWNATPTINNNQLVDEWLYLRNPVTKRIVRFTFTVDYFATAGDRRWWHDHRTPGGIAFTANSLGHMAKQQEWYEGRPDRIEWALRTAMTTIDTAAKKDTFERAIPFGPATYLIRDKQEAIRPYAWTAASKPSDIERLSGADCGTYGGYLHTDHAIRPEFFREDTEPQQLEQPYLMDFSYIFDPASPDYEKFMVGEEVSEEVVRDEIGRVEEMNFIASDQIDQLPMSAPAEAVARVEEALRVCQAWQMTDDELLSLL